MRNYPVIKNMRVYELCPYHSSRKSFYGKAVVKEYDGIYVLESYGTSVLRLNEDKSIDRLWGGYSRTTMEHVCEFLDQFDIEHGGKSWWEDLPVVY